MKEVPILPPLSSSSSSLSSSPKVADDLFKNLAAKQKSQWECDSCLTRNDSEKTKCLCCEQPRPGSENTKQGSPFKSSTSNSLPVADDFFKSLAAKQKSTQWECDVCMCKNDLEKDKCMSCESPKPGSKTQSTSLTPATTTNFKFGMPSNVPASTTAAPVASDDLFKSLVAQQKKTRWECDVCMTGNDVTSEKCVACETPKPGSKPAQAPAKSTSTFSFGMPAAATPSQNFSFGMPSSTPAAATPSVDPEIKKILDKQNAKWECDVCMTRNDPIHSKCLSCEHPKPGSTSQPQFLFGSNKMSSGVSLPKPSEVKFTFGVQPVTATATTNKIETAITSEKVEEVKDEVDKPKTFSFGIATTTTTSAVTSSIVSISQSSSIAKTATTTAASDSTPTFTFKAPAAAATAPSTNVVSASFTVKTPPKSDEKKEEVVKSPMTFSFGGKPEEKIASIVNIKSNDSGEKTEEKKESFVAPSSTPAFGGFKFGAFTASKTSTEEEKKDNEKPSSGGFSFNSSANLNFGAPVTEAKTSFGGFSSSQSSTSTATSVTATPSFTFGSPSTTATAAAKLAPAPSFSFGATSKKETEVTTQASSISTTTSSLKTTAGTFAFGSNTEKPITSPGGGGFSFNSPSNSVFGSQIAAPSSSTTTTNANSTSTLR